MNPNQLVVAAGGLALMSAVRLRRPFGALLGCLGGILIARGVRPSKEVRPRSTAPQELEPASVSNDDPGWAPESGEPSQAAAARRGRPYICSETGESEDMAPESGGRVYEPSLARAASQKINEASEESFPASDPPAWISSSL